MAAEGSKGTSTVKKEVVKTGEEQRVRSWPRPLLTAEPAEAEAALVLHSVRQEKSGQPQVRGENGILPI